MTVAIVERWNPYAKIRQDLFGVFDLLAFGGGKIMGIQVSSGSHHAARVRKIQEWAGLQEWNATGATAEVWTYSKTGERGKPKNWTLRDEVVK